MLVHWSLTVTPECDALGNLLHQLLMGMIWSTKVCSNTRASNLKQRLLQEIQQIWKGSYPTGSLSRTKLTLPLQKLQTPASTPKTSPSQLSVCIFYLLHPMHALIWEHLSLSNSYRWKFRFIFSKNIASYYHVFSALRHTCINYTLNNLCKCIYTHFKRICKVNQNSAEIQKYAQDT